MMSPKTLLNHFLKKIKKSTMVPTSLFFVLRRPLGGQGALSDVPTCLPFSRFFLGLILENIFVVFLSSSCRETAKR
jgi:hypothetical protein